MDHQPWTISPLLLGDIVHACPPAMGLPTDLTAELIAATPVAVPPLA